MVVAVVVVLILLVVNKRQISKFIPKFLGPPPERSLYSGTLALTSLGPGFVLFSSPMLIRVQD